MEPRPSENPADWLAEQFTYEYCHDCGGDHRHHTAVPLLGNWFARCDFAPGDDGTLHPHVQKDRDADDANWAKRQAGR